MTGGCGEGKGGDRIDVKNRAKDNKDITEGYSEQGRVRELKLKQRM
jgi:hypothetical protein